MAQMRPFAGHVSVITSAERLRMDPCSRAPAAGWAPYVPGLQVDKVDADHFRMMSDEPYVSQMAEILLGELEEGRAGVAGAFHPRARAAFRPTCSAPKARGAESSRRTWRTRAWRRSRCGGRGR